MKTLAISSNILFIIWIIIAVTGEISFWNRAEYWMLIFIIFPLLNFFMLINIDGGDNLLSLWIKVRKKMLRDKLEADLKE
jgi:hypothetical protein